MQREEEEEEEEGWRVAHSLSLSFFNKGFLYPRDTYLCDHRSEEEEEQRAEEVVGREGSGGGGGHMFYTLSCKGGGKMLCVIVYVCWMHKCIIRHH